MNKKLIFGLFLFIAVFVVSGWVAAEENGTSTVPSPTPVKTRTEVKETRDAIKREIKTTRNAVKMEVKETRDAVKVEIKDTREKTKEMADEAREQLKARVENAKKELEAKREELKTKREEFNQKIKEEREQLKERVKEKREELKERLKIIKDERKKATVEKLDQRLDALNEKVTDHFSKTLNKLDYLLIRVREKANKMEENGTDVSAVRMAITSASVAIETSRAAVVVQAAKTYTITITSETGLKQAVGMIRQQLNQDLRAVHATVKTAHESARNAAKTLVQLPKLSPSPSVSPSPEVEIE